jgi:osmotically-inducible protein OsmY
VRVAVVDGAVRLSGVVDSETDAKLASFFASRVPGVVDVHSDVEAPGAAADRDRPGGASTD